jgi:uncharacterized protein YcaQ
MSGSASPRPERVDSLAARRIALAATGLAHAAPARLVAPGGGLAPAAQTEPGYEPLAACAAAIEGLGSVQIDTISVVERAHHHILHARVPGYRPELLPALEAPPRRVIEYWSHAAAYLPLADWRFCLPRMERIRAQGHEWFRADAATVARVRDRVRDEGPLRTDAWASESEGPRGWWDWKPAKVALEYLFHAGELVSLTRQGFMKVYDLAERVPPPDLDLRKPTAAEMAAWYVDRAERALGIFAAADVAYMRKDLVEGVEDEIAHRVEAGSLIACELLGAAPPEDRPEAASPGRGGRPIPRSRLHYASPAALEAAARAPSSPEAKAWLLSPFDPLLIDRRRARRLFGVDYQLECYVPEAKRRFGYFALPIVAMEGDGSVEFAGLADAKLERTEALLRVKRLSLWREAPRRGAGKEGAARRADHAAALASAIAGYAAWLGARNLALERVEAADSALETRLRASLGGALRRALRGLPEPPGGATIRDRGAASRDRGARRRP